MMRAEIDRRARTVIARVLRVLPGRVREAADFRSDLGADRAAVVRLAAALATEFRVSISDAEAAFCETVGTAIDLIENKLEVRG